jgi:uncharacterized protein (UPF0210 family)
LNASFNVATTKAGIDLDSVKLVASGICEVGEQDISRTASLSPKSAESKKIDEVQNLLRNYHHNEKIIAHPSWSNCARVAVFANAPYDNPFMAGGYHGPPEPEIAIHIGVSASCFLQSAVTTLLSSSQIELNDICQKIKQSCSWIFREAESVRKDVIEAMRGILKMYSTEIRPPEMKDGIVDLSMASTDARSIEGIPIDSIGKLISDILGSPCGSHGTLGVLAMVIDSIKKGGVHAVSYFGGLSGTFIPISEDSGMADCVQYGALTFDKYEAMTSVCSVGVDMVPICLGSLSSEDKILLVAGMILDEAAIGVFNNKTTSIRVLPVSCQPKPNEWIVFLGGEGLLGAAPVLPIRDSHIPKKLSSLKGRIPPPITTLSG